MNAKMNPKPLIATMTIGVAILFLVTYFISIANGHNELCNPFITGCSDITHAGFYPFESYILKSILIPTATLMAVIFFFIKEWAVSLTDNNPKIVKQGKFMQWVAIIACVGLIIGTAVIDGDNTLMKLHLKAVAVFFVGMSICQVWYTIVEWKHTHKANKLPVILRRVALLVTIIVALLSVIIPKFAGMDAIVEWWGVYSLIFWFWTFSINKRVK